MDFDHYGDVKPVHFSYGQVRLGNNLTLGVVSFSPTFIKLTLKDVFSV